MKSRIGREDSDDEVGLSESIATQKRERRRDEPARTVRTRGVKDGSAEGGGSSVRASSVRQCRVGWSVEAPTGLSSSTEGPRTRTPPTSDDDSLTQRHTRLARDTIPVVCVLRALLASVSCVVSRRAGRARLAATSRRRKQRWPRPPSRTGGPTRTRERTPRPAAGAHDGRAHLQQESAKHARVGRDRRKRGEGVMRQCMVKFPRLSLETATATAWPRVARSVAFTGRTRSPDRFS